MDMNTVAGIGGGFALAVFSAARGAAVVSLELLRVVVKISNERAAMLHNERMFERLEWLAEEGMSPEDLLPDGWRDRVAGAFAGYLVTDQGELAECFSEHREWYAPGVDLACATSAQRPMWAAWRDDAGGPLDAPDWIAAGGVREEAGEIEQSIISRGEVAK